MSDISLQRYVAASAGGMLPCQSLHAYIGSTLRSMEEVVSSSSSSTAAYIVFSVQVDFVALLFCHVVSGMSIHAVNVILLVSENADRQFGNNNEICSLIVYNFVNLWKGK